MRECLGPDSGESAQLFNEPRHGLGKSFHSAPASFILSADEPAQAAGHRVTLGRFGCDMSSFSITQQQSAQPDTSILLPHGLLNMNVLSGFHVAMKAVAAKHIIVDLSGIPHMDSAGLGAFLTLHAALRKESRTLALTLPTKRVPMSISLTKADTT